MIDADALGDLEAEFFADEDCAGLIVHAGEEFFVDEDGTRSVPPQTVDKLRKMLAFLDEMDNPAELHALPSWKVHILTGDRKGTWSLSVTGNMRLTFRVDTDEREIHDVDLEDYH